MSWTRLRNLGTVVCLTASGLTNSPPSDASPRYIPNLAKQRCTEGTDGISDATLRREDWARLIRKPLKARGHALLDVCSPDGNIQRKVRYSFKRALPLLDSPVFCLWVTSYSCCTERNFGAVLGGGARGASMSCLQERGDGVHTTIWHKSGTRWGWGGVV